MWKYFTRFLFPDLDTFKCFPLAFFALQHYYFEKKVSSVFILPHYFENFVWKKKVNKELIVEL